MWIAYDIDFGVIESRYHIKQFGEAIYEKQIREKQFIVSEDRDRALGDYLVAHLARSGHEAHTITIPNQHHQVPDRVFHLIHPKSFFRGTNGFGGSTKYTIPLQDGDNKFSTIEDGISSRQSVNNEPSLSPANIKGGGLTLTHQNSQKLMPIQFEVKMAKPTSGEGKNLFLSNPKGQNAFAKMAMSQQVSPIHTRGIAHQGGKEKFDRSYLGSERRSIANVAGLTSQEFKDADGNVVASGGGLLQTKRKVKEYIESINYQLTETKKQEISQIRDFR